MFKLKKKKKTEFNDVELSERDLNSYIDYTLLDARAGDKDVEDLCNIAVKNKYYAVCVNPTNVEHARRYIDSKMPDTVKVVSVIGFPLGASEIETKVLETKKAINAGADEVDVVINISKAKQGDFGYIKNELSRVVRSSRGRVVKAIIETCYFNRDEILKLCKVCVKAKVDFVKTSTGYGIGGATPEVVELIKNAVDGKCRVKASGGIRTRADAFNMLRAGARRIGTSREI